MSDQFQDYIDNSLMDSGYVTQATILALETGSTLASSGVIVISQEEFNTILHTIMHDPDQYQAQSYVFTANNANFTTLTSTTDKLIGQNHDVADHGFIAVRTNTVLICAEYIGETPQYAEDVMVRVQQMINDSGY